MTDRDNKEAEIVQELVSNITQYQERMGISLSAVAEQATIAQKHIKMAFSNEDVKTAIMNTQVATEAARHSILKLVESNEFKNASETAEQIRTSLGTALLTLANNIDFESIKAMVSYVSTINFPTQEREISNAPKNDVLESDDNNETYEKNNPLTMLSIFIQNHLGVILDPKKDRARLFTLFILILLVSFGKPQVDKAIESTLFSDSSEETLEVSKQQLEETKRNNVVTESNQEQELELIKQNNDEQRRHHTVSETTELQQIAETKRHNAVNESNQEEIIAELKKLNANTNKD